MRPSDVGRRIERDHEASRTRLDELWRVIGTLSTGGVLAFERVLRLSRALHDVLTEQLKLEGRLLVPALREVDAWGKLRAEGLLSRHRKRSTELTALSDSCSRGMTHGFADELRRFIVGRWADMARADRHILSSGLLRDDVLGIDVDGG